MRPWIPGFVALAFAVATPAEAQVATIDPGMTRAEVVEILGRPVGERTVGQYMYLFYRNNCEIRCGMQDLVILQNDLVVDAIFRSSRRSYSGASSSPNGITPEPSGAGSLRTRETTGGSAGASGGRGGLITGGGSSTATEAPETGATTGAANTGAARTGNPAGRATVTGAGVVSTPIGASTSRATTTARGIDTTKVLDNVPPNPRDTSTIQPSRTQGQLTPSARDQQPIPYSGSRPSPRDSAVKAKAGQKPDTVKPPEE